MSLKSIRINVISFEVITIDMNTLAVKMMIPMKRLGKYGDLAATIVLLKGFSKYIYY